MKKALFFVLAFMAGIVLQAQEYRFNTHQDGFSISNRNSTTTTIHHNVSAVTIEPSERDGLEGQFITLSGIHIAN